MSYANREVSTTDSSPIELYEFRRGGKTWRYTSAAHDTLYATYPYSAVPIKRSNLEQSSEMGKTGLRITFARDVEVAQPFIATPPSEITLLTLYRQHRGDNETLAVWMGRVLNAEWRSSEVELNCEPAYTSLQRVGLRRLYQRNCPHVLYSTACGASAVTFRVTATVASINGPSLSVAVAAEYETGYFTGGYATWAANGLTEKRMITSHSDDAITLSATPPGLIVGDAITLYPGCDRTLNSCHKKFANSENFGGFPFIPTQNPFSGSPIY
ncbi:MAG: phage BR0599 family protein [Gammaproteobacteria bacterium]|nr:phage BR0599 family protein [Gammaproteobacteria bacterium]